MLVVFMLTPGALRVCFGDNLALCEGEILENFPWLLPGRDPDALGRGSREARLDLVSKPDLVLFVMMGWSKLSLRSFTRRARPP